MFIIIIIFVGWGQRHKKFYIPISKAKGFAPKGYTSTNKFK